MKEEINPGGTNLRNRGEGPPVASDAAGRDRSLFRCILENEVLNSGIEDPRELQTKKRRVFNVSCHFFFLNSSYLISKARFFWPNERKLGQKT